MKKLFIVLCGMFFMANSAFAAAANANPNAEKCFEWQEKDVYLKVFFNNNSSDIPTINGTNCTEKIKTELEPYLKNKEKDDLLVALIGTASQSASDPHNATLSKRRTATIKRTIQAINNKIEVVEYGAGEVNAYKVEKPDDRAVVIWFSTKDEHISDADRKTLNDTYTKLMGFGFISAERNVWKDAEGKFNTSRLLSDSVAGVVLGTAGGLITSSVVKKNQLEDGFEDIKCTIGGQTVGAWGDEMFVGKH
jgi:hypothetical protein